MKDDLISIIIPVYNRETLLLETLESIKKQTYKNWECIIIDDHSTDKTVSVIESYIEKDNRFKLFSRPVNNPKGANSCRNYGFQLSKGNYIQWFDSDDIMHVNNLEEKIKAIKNYNFVFSNLAFFEENANNYTSLEFINSKNIFVDYITQQLVLNTQVSLWKREIVENFTFNEKLKRAQELDFFSRVFYHQNIKGIGLNKVLVYIRKHKNSITGNYLIGQKEYLKDDTWVKKQIWLRAKKLNINIQNKTFAIYLKTVRKLMQFGYKKESLLTLLNSFFKASVKYKFIIIKFIFYTLTFSIFNKGSIKLKQIQEKI